jgi:hypothetical protein
MIRLKYTGAPQGNVVHPRGGCSSNVGAPPGNGWHKRVRGHQATPAGFATFLKDCWCKEQMLVMLIITAGLATILYPFSPDTK